MSKMVLYQKAELNPFCITQIGGKAGISTPEWGATKDDLKS